MQRVTAILKLSGETEKSSMFGGQDIQELVEIEDLEGSEYQKECKCLVFYGFCSDYVSPVGPQASEYW